MWHHGGSGKLGKLPKVNCPRSVGNRIKLFHSWPLAGRVVDYSQASHLGSPFRSHPHDRQIRQVVPRNLRFIQLPRICIQAGGVTQDEKCCPTCVARQLWAVKCFHLLPLLWVYGRPQTPHHVVDFLFWKISNIRKKTTWMTTHRPTTQTEELLAWLCLYLQPHIFLFA